MRPRWSTFETKTFHFSTSQNRDETKTSTLKTATRLRRSIFPNSQDRDETFNLRDRDETVMFQKHIETAVSQFKTPTGEVLSLDDLFLAGQIHYFLRDISASLMHCLDVYKTKVTRPKPRHYFFETETMNRQDRDVRFFQTCLLYTSPSPRDS